jgi:3-oxoisoapionate decarboxylase
LPQSPSTSSGSGSPAADLRIGVDSYSYHRLFGEIRAGEDEPSRAFHDPQDPVRHARALGIDGVSIETCFLPPPAEVDVAALREAAGRLELVISWGHRHGLEFGASSTALPDLLEWLELAATLGCRVVRCVAASPPFRGLAPVEEQIARTVPPLREAAARARSLGLRLALENHGDLRAPELLELVERVGDDALGVCLDTANALRVGDEALEATELLAPLTAMVHLKDIEHPDPAQEPAGPRSVVYGEGVVPLREVLAALERAGFDGLTCVELGQLPPGADELELVERCVAWLREYDASG